MDKTIPHPDSPTRNNTNSSLHHLGHDNSTFFTIPQILELVISISVFLLNIAEITMIVRIRRRKTIYEKLLVSLSVADGLFGFVNGLQQVTRALISKKAGGVVSEGTSVVYFFFIFSSLQHLLVISLDRLWAICSPMKHRVIVTRRRIHIVIGLLWLFATVVTKAIFLDTFLHRETFRRRAIIHKTSINIAIMVLVADGLFLVVNVILVCAIRRKKPVFGNENNPNTKAMERTVQRVCTTITVMFILFTAPWAIIKTTSDTKSWTHLLLILNSGMNSIAYFFKGYTSGLFRCCEKKDAISTASIISVNMVTVK